MTSRYLGGSHGLVAPLGSFHCIDASAREQMRGAGGGRAEARQARHALRAARLVCSKWRTRPHRKAVCRASPHQSAQQVLAAALTASMFCMLLPVRSSSLSVCTRMRAQELAAAVRKGTHRGTSSRRA